MPTIHLTIWGRVQGVSYRASAKKQADQIGVGGWVKNVPGGQVEAVVCGTPDQVAQFIKWAQKGPMFARVDRIEQKALPDQQTIGFVILH